MQVSTTNWLSKPYSNFYNRIYRYNLGDSFTILTKYNNISENFTLKVFISFNTISTITDQKFSEKS